MRESERGRLFHRWNFCHLTLSGYLWREFVVMESNLKATLGEVNSVSTTADIWAANNKSFLSVSSSLDQLFNFGAKHGSQQGPEVIQ